MARYISEDEFIEWVKEHWCADCQNDNGLRCRACCIDDAIDLVEEAPEADVVPRAEVDKIIGKLECLLCHVTWGRLSKHTYDLRTMETVATNCINETYNDGWGEGYKECAREIFEEIGKILYKHTNIAIKEKSVTCELTIDYIGEDIAELKKKYTGGSENE